MRCSWILFPRNLFSFLMQLVDNKKKWLRNLGAFDWSYKEYAIAFWNPCAAEYTECFIHLNIVSELQTLQCKNYLILLSIFTSHFQEQFNLFSGICNLHDYSPSFSRWVPQNPGWVDIVRRSNKDSFHRETESTLKLSVLDKVTPKYCSWFLAVIQRLFSPGRLPFFFAANQRGANYRNLNP